MNTEQNSQNITEAPTDANNVLPAGVSRVDVNAKWECCKCGWIGTHSESADKTPVVNDAWLLVCPKCGNKDEFYACSQRTGLALQATSRLFNELNSKYADR